MRPFDPVRDIQEFAEKFGLETPPVPAALAADVQDYRVRFKMEELDEYIAAATRARLILDHHGQLFPNDTEKFEEAMEKALDGLVDIVYVTIGTAVTFHGFDFREAWQRVHAANMEKVRAASASDARSKRKHACDVVKPEGWEPPYLRDLVKALA
jgi:predicted HAD superfamily Cof-like phosphohydrolase